MNDDLTRTQLFELLERERERNGQLAVELADLRDTERRLTDAAIYDALTELHSRAYVRRELTKWWAAACYERVHERRGTTFADPFAVVLVDIDHFKRVNDQHGHDVGDVMLRAVADVLRETGRETDIVGRWGGEEFLVILPQTSQAQANLFACRLRRAVENAGIGIGKLGYAVTISLGVSGAGPDNPAETPDAVVKLADEALYAAKAQGRNRVAVRFSPAA